MNGWAVALGALALAWPAATCLAQSAAVSELVVTAEKREADSGTPHVTFVRRADNLITEVKVVCDTRDPSQRRDELRSTLRNMIHAATADGHVELGVGDDVIGRFDETMLDEVIKPDNRIDTSVAVVVIKTHVSAADTFDTASGRITAFIEKTPKVGRTEILREQDWSLTIIGPEQYRPQIIAKIADDARATAQAFGPGYGAMTVGLQKPVDWYQFAPLDLALFIPYQLTIEPLPGGR
jgi:hypothetical protein